MSGGDHASAWERAARGWGLTALLKIQHARLVWHAWVYGLLQIALLIVGGHDVHASGGTNLLVPHPAAVNPPLYAAHADSDHRAGEPELLAPFFIVKYAINEGIAPAAGRYIPGSANYDLIVFDDVALIYNLAAVFKNDTNVHFFRNLASVTRPFHKEKVVAQLTRLLSSSMKTALPPPNTNTGRSWRAVDSRKKLVGSFGGDSLLSGQHKGDDQRERPDAKPR